MRFKIAWLMIAVAVAGVALGARAMARRRAREFEALARYHRAEQGNTIACGRDGVCRQLNDRFEEVSDAKDRWHRTLEQKYLLAARRPWLPVEPDPPEPW